MTPTYKNTLTCKTWIGSLERMYQYAVELGYEYILWNDRVYKVLPFCKNVEDTGMTVEDLK
jgi:hypothetical protein